MDKYRVNNAQIKSQTYSNGEVRNISQNPYGSNPKYMPMGHSKSHSDALGPRIQSKTAAMAMLKDQ